MKPIIVDMKDMSDSTEVYASKPNRFLVYTIYLILIILAITILWMYFSKIDIVVKSTGMFRSNEITVDVSSTTAGIVGECNISEGKYVKRGDVLFTIETEQLEEMIAECSRALEDVNERLEILKAYDQYLTGEKDALDAYCGNQYYTEFAGKKDLLELSTQSTHEDIQAQKKQCQQELESIDQMIGKYEEQIKKLQQTGECIEKRQNVFNEEDNYYRSIVNSYLSNYSVKESQYDIRLDELMVQIERCQEQVQDNDTEELEQQIAELENSMQQTLKEKDAELSNLKLQQMASIEQQIESVESTLNSAKLNQASLQAQLNAIGDLEQGNTEKINRLTEQQNNTAEIHVYEDKKKEYENSLKQYDLENGYAEVTADISGYIYMNQELNAGSYVTQGSIICQILPKNKNGYYADIYVENSDVAKIKEGQEVSFEIAAYPSDEYGYFTGVVESISKDIKVDQTSGSAYYLVKVRCGCDTVTNKDGKTGTIMNGMSCQAKVVVDEKSVLRYLLEKIELLD